MLESAFFSGAEFLYTVLQVLRNFIGVCVCVYGVYGSQGPLSQWDWIVILYTLSIFVLCFETALLM